ncbi:MAG: thioredoxin [Clostridiales bacterium]|nr:thioredoxin [Clostridiales bacterium]
MSLTALDDYSFENEVLNSKGTVLVDFFAVWCAPCQMLAPIVEEISKEYKVFKVDVDTAPNTARKYQVESIPTLMVFKDGKAVKSSVGFCSKEEILKLLCE